VAVEREDDFGLIVTFSDGTCDGYVVEELLNLRPHRLPVKSEVDIRHREQVQGSGRDQATP
jgi:hypothetical protein